MTQSKFKIGDKVMVINVRDCYRYYVDIAELMCLTNWNEGASPDKNSEAIIINIEQQPEQNTLLIGIKTKDGKEYIIKEKGLELLESSTSDNPISDVIQISRTLLNEYYDASTVTQRQYINDNFKIDGTTTVDAIIGLEKIMCDDWKPIIRKNHPKCFPKAEFDFSEYVKKFSSQIFSREQYKMLGFTESPIQIRIFGEHEHKGFYLSNDVGWELGEEQGAHILVPIKK